METAYIFYKLVSLKRMVGNMAVPRQSWHLNDAGILRKKDEDDELLVFGYSCKIFRDDEKALFIDQGKHLIPWMGDESLKIDRYDGRAALADLRESEAPLGGFDVWASLSDSERRVEQLCDEERYRALTHNEEEEALYQEEELKRLQQALSAENTYGQVAYQYDETGQPVGEQKPEVTGVGGAVAEEDEPFVAPQELDIPLNMVLPETVKANAIIEKTAMFINKQGAQMEILLKMKQARNPQFQFLSYDDPLHSYYRHLLMAIKTGRYQPKPPKEEEEDEGDQDDEDDGYYLHPSLASSASRIELAPSIPTINYKPSADCAYSMLVNKIRDKQAAFVAEETVPAVSATSAPPALSAASNAHSEQESAEEEDAEEEEAEPAPYAAYKGSREDSMRAGKVDSINACPVVGVGRKRRKRRGARRKRRGSGGMEKGDFGGGTVATPYLEPPPEMQIVIDKMASYVAKNGRDFETIVKNKGDPRFAFLDATHQFNSYYRLRLQQYELQNAPPVTIQEASAPSPLKKMKRGQDKAQTEEKISNQSKSPEQNKGVNQEKESNKSTTKLAPVCFSIKKPKEVEILPLEKRNALLLEETSEEEDCEEESEGKTAEHQAEETESKVKIKQPIVERMELSQPYVEPVNENTEVSMTQDVPVLFEEKKEEIVASVVVTERQESMLVDNEEIKIEEEEMLASAVVQTIVAHENQSTPCAVDENEAEKDMFLDLGESNSPGGLSPASAANRERHLQQERKRKAAIFLRMIKKEHPPDVPKPSQGSDSVAKADTTIETIIVEDDDSYPSIPSPAVVSLSKTSVPSPAVLRKDEWSFSSPAGGGHNGLSSYSSRDKSYRKLYPSENDGREGSPTCHRRHHHHHHHRGHKHKHRKETSLPMSPSSTHKRARSRSRSRSKTRSDRPRKEGSSMSKHKKGKKKKARSRSRSRTRRHPPSAQGRHHHKKSKHHSRHKGKRREREEVEVTDDHQRRHRSRERKYVEKRKMPENFADEGQSSKVEKKRKGESSAGSSEDRSSGSESSDSRDSAR